MADEKVVKPIEPAPPMKVAPKTETKVKAAVSLKDEILKEIGEILNDYGGKESDIPPNHKYWELVNQYRAK